MTPPESGRLSRHGPITVRLPAALIAVAALVGGLSAGLARAGTGSPLVDPGLHAPLLVLGFFGVVIGAERAVGLRRPWAWGAPGLAAASVVAMVVGGSRPAAILAVGSGMVLCAVFWAAWRIQPLMHTAAMALGAVCYLVAAGVWSAGAAVPEQVPWLAGFLVLTIAGERLELTRLAALPLRASIELGGWMAFFVMGAVWAQVDVATGTRVAGAGLVGIALWLGRHDLARRTVKMSGVTRFMGAALLAGYVWLGTSGLIWLSAGLSGGGLLYDAAIHSLFLGFVMSMVFAHAPVVVPAVLDVDLPYHPVLWAPLALLHTGVAVRVVGDLAGDASLRRWAGEANVATFVVFAVVAVGLVVRARR